jgi:hypothetical protein
LVTDVTDLTDRRNQESGIRNQESGIRKDEEGIRKDEG